MFNRWMGTIETHAVFTVSTVVNARAAVLCVFYQFVFEPVGIYA